MSNIIHQADLESQYQPPISGKDEKNWNITFPKDSENYSKDPPIIRARTMIERRLYGLIRSFESRNNFQVCQIILTRNDQGYLTVQVTIKYKD